VEIKVPDLGDFDEVEVIEVMVNPGDTISENDPLITLETDKAAMDVPSTGAGKISEVRVSTGDRIRKGDVIVILEDDDKGHTDRADQKDQDHVADAGKRGKATGEAANKPEQQKKPDRSAKSAKPEQQKKADKSHKSVKAVKSAQAASEAEQGHDNGDSGDEDSNRRQPAQPAESRRGAGPALPPVDEAGFSRAHASPSVRKLARELGVDLASVKGSGRKGRVTDEDVKHWVKDFIAAGPAHAAGTLPDVPRVDFSKFGEIRREPLSRVQKISGPRLHASWVNLPHVTQHDEADITALEDRRQALKEKTEARGIKLTPMAFVMRACVLALQEFSQFNASLDPDGEHLVLKRYMHLGFAADTPNGLMVPVIRDADQMDVFELAEQLARLSRKARESRLTAAEMQGGCFTVTSLGGIGGTAFTPIINAPEVAILGVSKSRMMPIWDAEEERFKPRLMLPLSLSYDHRVIDGAQAARFTTHLAATLANVARLMEAIP
jgi:pyruvate dehydrogenase E2 component (dihydrolipoamide acetyltransferase)